MALNCHVGYGEQITTSGLDNTFVFPDVSHNISILSFSDIPVCYLSCIYLACAVAAGIPSRCLSIHFDNQLHFLRILSFVDTAFIFRSQIITSWVTWPENQSNCQNRCRGDDAAVQRIRSLRLTQVTPVYSESQTKQGISSFPECRAMRTQCLAGIAGCNQVMGC